MNVDLHVVDDNAIVVDLPEITQQPPHPLAKYKFRRDIGFLPELLLEMFAILRDEGPEARRTLQTCSLVSMAWADLTLKYRFKHVRMTLDPRRRGVQPTGTLYELFCNVPSYPIFYPKLKEPSI